MIGKIEEYELYKDIFELVVFVLIIKFICNMIDEYVDLIVIIMVIDNVFVLVVYIFISIWCVVLIFDMDFIIFIVENWVIWYYEDEFVKLGDLVVVVMIFLVV